MDDIIFLKVTFNADEIHDYADIFSTTDICWHEKAKQTILDQLIENVRREYVNLKAIGILYNRVSSELHAQHLRPVLSENPTVQELEADLKELEQTIEYCKFGDYSDDEYQNACDEKHKQYDQALKETSEHKAYWKQNEILTKAERLLVLFNDTGHMFLDPLEAEKTIMESYLAASVEKLASLRDFDFPKFDRKHTPIGKKRAQALWQTDLQAERVLRQIEKHTPMTNSAFPLEIGQLEVNTCEFWQHSIIFNDRQSMARVHRLLETISQMSVNSKINAIAKSLNEHRPNSQAILLGNKELLFGHTNAASSISRAKGRPIRSAAEAKDNSIQGYENALGFASAESQHIIRDRIKELKKGQSK